MKYLKTITFVALLFLGSSLQANENPEGFDMRMNVEIYSSNPEVREELGNIQLESHENESFKEYIACLTQALEAVARALHDEPGHASLNFHVRDEPLGSE